MAFVTLQLRRDTAANWTAADPTLASGEMGIETDTNLFKIGDGVTEWTSLAYGGLTGATGAAGADGADGEGVPVGGTTGQALIKSSNTDYATEWGTVASSPGGSDTQVQFNDGGSFGGDAGLTFNKTSKAITLGGATVTTSSPVIDAAQTWNAVGTTFTGLKFNATDTASAAGSLLMDLQVGGSSKASVSKAGTLIASTSVETTRTGTQYVLAPVLYSNTGGLSTHFVARSIYVSIGSSVPFGFVGSGNADISPDTILTRRAAANLRLGAADAAAPVAQTLSVQSVVAGTTNIAGANLTITGSQGTGTGAGGSIIFQVAPAGTTGTAQNALQNALAIDHEGQATFTIKNTSGTPTVTIGKEGSGSASIIGSSAFIVGSVNGNVQLSPNAGSGASILGGVYAAIGDTTVRLYRDGNDILALRRATSAQAFRVYNTFTATDNFERANIFWDSNVLKIGTEKGSVGGTARALEFQTDGTTRLTIAATGHITTTSYLQVASYLQCAAGAIGSSAGLYFGGAATNRVDLQATGVGVLAIGRWSTGDVTLQFGGTTSSFPALKRSSASLIVRLADDTANAALESASLKTDAPTGGTAATWKLGTVASVTPTLQNRTIEVDIGGTIYYISAKTTND
jgi:hypothetical protein